MTATLPPELMSAEQRRERISELEGEIGREWARFAITELVLVSVPLGIFLLAYFMTDAIAGSLLAPVMIAGGVWCGLLVAYWLQRRIAPLQRERERLERFDATTR